MITSTVRSVLAQWCSWSSRSKPSADDDVVAIRFDEESVTDDLARWCDGQVVQAEGLDGDMTPTIYVPTSRGPRPALLGDWIVQTPEGVFAPCSPTDFAARFEPQT